MQATKEKLDNISLYAENIDIEKEFRNRQFFFRNCMNDLFNLDKFLIIGSKGTGKSYIYSALKKVGAISVKTINMSQGNKISRLVAWTFLSETQHLQWSLKRWKAS